jgi:hypothetical protein
MVEGASILPVPEATPSAPEKKEEKKGKDKDKEKKKYGILAVEKEPPKQERQEKPEKKSPLEDVKPVPEEKAPAEEIGREEHKVIVQESAGNRLAELPEVPEEGEPEEMAAQEFLAEAAESGDIDEAIEKTAAKLEATPEQLAELTAEPEVLELEAEEDIEEPEEEPADEEVVFDRRAEAEDEDEEEPEDPALAGATPSGSSGGTPPPMPPTPPAGPAGPAGPGERPPFGMLGGFGPDQVPGGGPGGFNPNAVPAANTAPAPDKHVPEYYQASPAAMALFGGIIGYLVGRRRGRIKTEKRLLPVQKKLEKQVTNLQFELQEKEDKIRRIAAEKVRHEGPQIIETLKKDRPEKVPEARKKAPEAHLLHAPNAPERIGQVLVTAEAEPLIKTERAPEKAAGKVEKAPEQAARPLTERQVETLNRAELLEVSQKIVVEGTTLRQIYETHLIGEKGLRRLVGEHLRGGDLAKALRREIVEREIDFERDPALRDMAPDGGAASGGGRASNPSTLDEMLAKAGAKVGDNSEEAAYFKARAAYEADQHGKHRQQRRMMDASLGIVITVLLALVIYLVLIRT